MNNTKAAVPGRRQRRLPYERRADNLVYITPILIGLNLAAFALMTIRGVPLFGPTGTDLLGWGANYGPLTLAGAWWRMITSLFLHFGLIHLMSNIVILFSIGSLVENLAGNLRFLILYLVAGLAGCAASLAWNPFVVSAGASGAIFGLYGAMLAFLLRYRDTVAQQSFVTLWKGAAIFLGYNLIYGLTTPEVDLAGHLGGLMGGFVVGLLLLEPASQHRASWRNAAAGITGAALVVAPIILLPTPDNFRVELQRFAKIEDAAISLYNVSIDKLNADQLKGEQFADILDQRILPGWKAERETLMKMMRLSDGDRQLVSRLVHYMTVREEGWDLMSRGARRRDIESIKQATQKNQEADKLADTLAKPPEK